MRYFQKHILILGISLLILSACDEDKYGDWKILNEQWLENLKETHKDDPDFIVTESGLCYKIIHKGQHATPYSGSYLRARYTGKYITGKSFDSSAGTQPMPLSGTVQGWQEGILKIKNGGRILLYIPYDLGYGTKASGSIPPYSTLEFDVELLEVLN
jgi:FKBP-type peptidyl-prolyl cis-trans isomerase